MQETLVQSLGQEVPWRSDGLPTPVFLGFPGGSCEDLYLVLDEGMVGVVTGPQRDPLL